MWPNGQAHHLGVSSGHIDWFIMKTTNYVLSNEVSMSRTPPWGVPTTPWVQGGPRSDARDLCRHRWESPSDSNLMWVRASGVENASHPCRLGVMRVTPWALGSLWHPDFGMFKNSPIWGMSSEIWQFEWGVAHGQRPGTIVTWEWRPRVPRLDQPKLPQYLHKCSKWGVYRHLRK